MEILEELQALRRLVQSGESFSSEEEDMISLRAATLDEWTSQKKNDNNIEHNRNRRNLTAHGGRVRADIATIKIHSSQTARVTKWKDAFLNHYGVPFHHLENMIGTIPRQLQTILDRRASAHCMDIWKTLQNKDRRRRIISNANDIIKAWFERADDLFKEGSKSLMSYNQVEKDWVEGYFLANNNA